MSRFPNTRMSLARLFANLAVCSLPASERACLNAAFKLSDLLKARAYTIRLKGQYWRVGDDEKDYT